MLIEIVYLFVYLFSYRGELEYGIDYPQKRQTGQCYQL